MEASAAGLAGAAPAGDAGGGAPGQTPGGEQQQAPQGADAIAQMAETLQGLAGTQEEMRQFLSDQAAAGQQTQQQAETPAAPTPPDLSFLDETSPQYDPQKAAERLQEVMRAEAGTETQRLLQEALGPLQQQVGDMQRSQEADALVAEFPELGKAEVAEAVVKTAQQYAEMVGNPELAANTAFVRMTYMAGRAAQLAQQQEGAAAGAGAATLEGAGGASPGGAGQGATQTADSIATSWADRRSVLPKW
jgi:hypothetical protein